MMISLPISIAALASALEFLANQAPVRLLVDHPGGVVDADVWRRCRRRRRRRRRRGRRVSLIFGGPLAMHDRTRAGWAGEVAPCSTGRSLAHILQVHQAGARAGTVDVHRRSGRGHPAPRCRCRAEGVVHPRLPRRIIARGDATMQPIRMAHARYRVVHLYHQQRGSANGQPGRGRPLCACVRWLANSLATPRSCHILPPSPLSFAAAPAGDR